MIQCKKKKSNLQTYTNFFTEAFTLQKEGNAQHFDNPSEISRIKSAKM